MSEYFNGYYEFVTVWRIDAPREMVWDAIYHSECWPDWWPGAESVIELEKGNCGGIGNLRRYCWKGALPYRLTFDIRTRFLKEGERIEGIAAGDVEGSGLWSFSGRDDKTIVRYEWRVRTTKRWMILLEPVARPLFRWNHDKIMAWGASGLARLLGARLEGVEKVPVRA